MKYLEIINTRIPGWKPSDAAFIKELRWSNGNLNLEFLCQLRQQEMNWPDLSEGFFQISLEFKKVTNLRLDFIGMGMHQIAGFDIISVASNGWEGINYHIEDYENGSIAFECYGIEVSSIETEKYRVTKTNRA